MTASTPDRSHSDTSRTKAIAQSFGQAANTYDDYALVQEQCAGQLLAFLDDEDITLPPGPILEIGCGTGFLSQQLLNHYSRRTLCFTDLAPEMVQACQQRLDNLTEQLGISIKQELLKQPSIKRVSLSEQHLSGQHSQHYQVQQLDGVALKPESTATRLSLIASSFALQWFDDPQAVIEQWLQCLLPGGWLAVAFPTCHSFRQFRQQCEALDFPYPVMAMPDPTPLIGYFYERAKQCVFHQDFVSLEAPNAKSFLRHFHRIGAVPTSVLKSSALHSSTPNSISNSTSRSSPASLSTGQLRQLIRHWDAQSTGAVVVDYHVTYLLLQR